MKLQQTTDYLLLIDEEADMINTEPINTYYLHKEDGHESIEIKTKDKLMGFLLSGKQIYFKIIAYYPLSKEAKELDLPLLPPFEEVDVEKLAYDWLYDEKTENKAREGYPLKPMEYGFIEGYKAAKSKGRFTLEDIKDALNQLADKAEYGISNFAREEIITKIIQSLSTQKLPSEFIPEYEKMHKKNSDGEDIGFPVHDSDKFKTITNSEGKKELVGAYTY